MKARMSSLNPIVKIGKQLTEAMILKGKARQRESKETFNAYLKELNKAMVAAIANGDQTKAAEINEKCKKFDKFEIKHTELESAYNNAHDAATEAVSDIKSITFEMEKKAVKAGADRIKDIANRAKASVNDYVVKEDGEKIKGLAAQLNGLFSAAKKTHSI